MVDYEKFQGKIWKTGNSLVITIPEKISNFGGYKEGDQLKVMCKKAYEE